MEKKIYTVKGGDCRPLPHLLGNEAVGEASRTDLLVLLSLCELGSADASRLAELLSLAAPEVEAALAFWRGAGILTLTAAMAGEAETTDGEEKEKRKRPLRGKELRGLGAEEMASVIRERGLAELVEAAEQQCGRLFNRTELSILVGMVEELGLDGGYILTLLAYCDGTSGEKKPLRYAERVAVHLCEHGIDTTEALEEYIRERELLHSVEGQLRRMFGIGTRKLSEREESAFLRWTETYGYCEDVIGAAYDVTVNAVGKASVAYTDKILAHWHGEGVRTVSEAEALLEREKSTKRRGAAKEPKKTAASSFEVGDFFQRAIERSYRTDKK